MLVIMVAQSLLKINAQFPYFFTNISSKISVLLKFAAHPNERRLSIKDELGKEMALGYTISKHIKL